MSKPIPLRKFIAGAEPLRPEERRLIVEQSIMLLENFYAHLPLKCAMYAVDPLRRLRLLRHRLSQFGPPPLAKSDLAFHAEVIDIFTSLRDLHTRYFLPAPFAGANALLPFNVEVYFENGNRKYVATHLLPNYRPPKASFQPGVEIVHWHGVPIARAVEIAGRDSAGNNPAAQHANGLMRLTSRDLTTLAPPDAEWVDVGYRTPRGEDEIRVHWLVHPSVPAENGDDAQKRKTATDMSVAHEIHHVRQARKVAVAPHVVRQAKKIAAAPDKQRFLRNRIDTLMPDYFKLAVHQAKNGSEYGYIRIFSFPDEDFAEFVEEFRRILTVLPENGLIIDVRDNPGGKILAAEQLLQLLTSRRPIEPQRLCFLNTPLTLQLCQLHAQDYDLHAWIASIERSIETGATFSASYPIKSKANYCNEFKQEFRGPVVVVTSARSCSAAEFFSAGFQDHGIGPIVGIDLATGAAGAHMKQYNALREFFRQKHPFEQDLPRGAGMTLALRRSVRVGRHAGTEVEDFGVAPDVPYEMTRRDVLEHNTDLIEYAASLLSALRVRRTITKNQGTRLDVTAQTVKWSDGKKVAINDLDVLVNWRLHKPVRLTDRQTSITLDDVRDGQPVEVRGYFESGGKRHLIAVNRV